MLRIHLLRAVNVGGAKLPMAELRVLATELGATNVSTYIASGNLLCVPPGAPEEFDRLLERAIEAKFGYFREVISRSPQELEQALERHPFEVLDPSRSFINFLLEAPAPQALAKAKSYPTGRDLWDAVGRDLHIRYWDGAGRPQLKDAAIRRALGVPGTARNLRTVAKLFTLACSP
ncbi:DUF1697 domain-containing protein [Jonesiaceae bacterium BS-20]|uniref:DUF1697 domain-containing protein n=1 Tax=Jonesiaceae bacterium BS-20 TaxID=3120821 RepID=A0AAU7DUM9_9MICO